MNRGKFIVLEGIDGSGKGTIGKMLASYLFDKAKSSHLFLTREPYDSPYLADIRRILKETTDPRKNARELAELFTKDRRVHAEVMERHLSEGTHVICDRYKHSTLVFQSAQGVPMADLLKMHEGLPVPDLTIILDVPEDVAMGRILSDKKRTHREVFEQQQFLAQLRKGYQALPELLSGERIAIINGNQKPEEVFVLAKAEVDKLF